MADDARVLVPAADQSWLHMDRPTKLMYGHGLFILDGEPDLAQFREVCRERMINRYRVFSQCAVQSGAQWYWEDDPAFDLARHLTRVELPGASDAAALQDHIGRAFATPFDHDHPLWNIDLIVGVHGFGPTPTSAIHFRAHHAITDGIRIVQLILSLFDHVGDEHELPPRVGRDNESHGLLAAGPEAVRRGLADAGDIGRNLVDGALHLPRTVAGHLRPSALQSDLAALIHPGRLVDVFELLGSTQNESINTVGEMSRVLASGHEVTTAWSGTPGIDKLVAWVDGLDLAAMKTVARRHDATLNDLYMTLVSLALTDYLRERDALVEEIHWMMPMSLQPLDIESAPTELGNHFCLVFVPMPLGSDDFGEVVHAVQTRMQRVKNSQEPVITFGLQKVMARLPRAMANALTDLFASKAAGVLSAVPGPATPMSVCGVPVASILAWPPNSGDQAMSMCMFSYSGEVTIGLACDATLLPDPQVITGYLRRAYDRHVVGAI